MTHGSHLAKNTQKNTDPKHHGRVPKVFARHVALTKIMVCGAAALLGSI